MPIWLSTLVGVLTALTLFAGLTIKPITAAWKSHKETVRKDFDAVNKKLDEMCQQFSGVHIYFDKESALGQALGTIPERLNEFEERLSTLEKRGPGT